MIEKVVGCGVWLRSTVNLGIRSFGALIANRPLLPIGDFRDIQDTLDDPR